MMTVTLFVKILAAVSCQKHLLHRLSLGNWENCAEKRTPWAQAPCASSWCSVLKPAILWRGIFYKPRSLFHHMWLTDRNHQPPATILFPGFFLLSTTDQGKNVWKRISFFLFQSSSSWQHLQNGTAENLEQSISRHFLRDISIPHGDVHQPTLKSHPFFLVSSYILTGVCWFVWNKVKINNTSVGIRFIVCNPCHTSKNLMRKIIIYILLERLDLSKLYSSCLISCSLVYLWD